MGTHPAFEKMHEDVKRRMCDAADEILRGNRPGYAALARPERASELAQLLRDIENLAMLGKPELINDYLRVVGGAEAGNALAPALIAKRREIELDAIDTADFSELFPRSTPPGLKWSIVTRVVVCVCVAFFALLAFAFLMVAPPTDPAANRWSVPLVLLAIDALMIWLFFFGGRIRGIDRLPMWKTFTLEESVRRKIRKDIERRHRES